MFWPFLYTRILEHGRCAKGSSNFLCGKAVAGLAIFFPPEAYWLWLWLFCFRVFGISFSGSIETGAGPETVTCDSKCGCGRLALSCPTADFQFQRTGSGRSVRWGTRAFGATGSHPSLLYRKLCATSSQLG